MTKIWIAKEGRETFKFKAETREKALAICEMYNAVLIKEIEL